MITGKKVLGIIPARGGSKGLPGKNIKCLNGIPLLAYTIQAAQNSKYIDSIVVSTDSESIAEVSKQYGVAVPFLRPAKLATDESPSCDAIIHVFDKVKDIENQIYDLFILLQPTSPFRSAKHIDESIEKYDSEALLTSLVSISKVSKSPYWMKIINENGHLINLLKEETTATRRQDLPEVYVMNGAIYISETERYKKLKNFDSTRMGYYLMDEQSSLDIDTIKDFNWAEMLIKEEKNES